VRITGRQMGHNHVGDGLTIVEQVHVTWVSA
jgi:hypothetical protein